ncbi:unnamed protein product [Adineta steineri]|uniref:Uncharacterized protein n=1 Tax=Adineta steineri TaxID=433720 RepID=A0A815STL0_9BILA|nr:unnamed protein product [Adineta steineri]
MAEEDIKFINDTLNSSPPSTTEQDIPNNSCLSSKLLNDDTNLASNADQSNLPKRQEKPDESTIPPISQDIYESKPAIKLNNNNQSKPQPLMTSSYLHYQDISFNEKNSIYCSFSNKNDKKPLESTSNNKRKSSESNPIEQILDKASTAKVDFDYNEENEEKKKIAYAKKLLFPGALATSFSEVADTLRDERRQEFCPIYKDETPEQIALRQSKRKPIGSLLAKRIRWDDIKRKREEEEKKQAQMQYHYGPYGPVYNNNNQQSFTNPYEQYYTEMQNQYDLMVKMTHAQQEHSGFWPEYQQSSFQNNDQTVQNSMQHQAQPYTYPFPSMNANQKPAYTPADYYNLHLISNMQPPPPPPSDEL